jgi:ABC-2 type transport system permease protein
MRNFLIIWRRELAACFLSPIAYITLIIFLIFAGGTFLFSVLRHEGEAEFISVLAFSSLTLWLTILASVVCMRLFAEEVRQGTLEMLMTIPVTELEIVMGKYAGAITFMCFASIPVICSIPLLAWIAPGMSIHQLDAGAIAGGCGVLFLLINLYTAIGIVFSLLTRNQIVAALATFCFIWFVLLTGWFISFIPWIPSWLINYISITTHVEEWSRGVIDTRGLALLVSITVFLLFVSVRILESKRWK